ncbi:hypothetical protein ACWD6I_01880 [Streptomyces sp. NPDC002454]
MGRDRPHHGHSGPDDPEGECAEECGDAQDGARAPGALGFQAISACGNGARTVLPKGRDYGRNTYYRYKITPTRYKVPAGGATGKYGKDVRHLDGHSGWNRSPRIRRAYVPPNSHFQLTKNRSVKWSGAVSAHGVKLGASTQYDRDHKQRIGRRAHLLTPRHLGEE